ncbi:MAG: AAA family ATPase [Bacteroidetes bacterium]|nr:AAA family ATPase [Bacteroidota bacterium]
MFKRILTDELVRWKSSVSRKPLILRGARQVGKTTLVEMFAVGFDYFVHLNLDKSIDRQIFEKNDNIATIIQILYLKANISPAPDAKVLIFIDEIQNSPEAIKLLRYFYEQANHLYVIAAGSLLESILDNQISFPVGRVEYLILRPFSFGEYLTALQENEALTIYNNFPFPEYGHKKLLALFAEYCLIGGMPEVVKHYIEHKDLVAVGRIFENLITAYSDDVEKYAKNDNHRKIIRHIIHNAIKMAGERIKFEGFASSNYKSKDIGEGFRTLEKTYLLSLVFPTTNTKLPLIENIRKSPKLHILDTGILNYFAGMQLMILNNDLIDTVFEGKIAEHIVGQELLSLKSNVSAKNYFWIKEKKQSNAEVDYVLQIDNLLIPVEVKLGKTGRLRSLMEFIDLCPHNFAVRIYSGELKIETTKTLKGKEFTLLNLPFYLTGKAPMYIKRLLIAETET